MNIMIIIAGKKTNFMKIALKIESEKKTEILKFWKTKASNKTAQHLLTLYI